MAASSVSYNSRVIQEIVSHVGDLYKRLLDENVYCDDDEKKLIHERMKTIYQNILAENIQITGDNGNGKDSREKDAENQAEEYLNQVVLPEFDSLICSTVEMRRTMPPKVAAIVAQEQNLQLKAECLREVEVGPLDLKFPASIEEKIHQTKDQISESSSALSRLSKNIHMPVAEFTNLQRVINMQATIGQTKTEEVIFAGGNSARAERDEDNVCFKTDVNLNDLQKGFTKAS